METFKDIPLRERKFAQTKIALLNAMLKKLTEKPLLEISIKELCDDADVSEGTFFNYFKKKNDLIIYFIQIWATETQWQAKKTQGLNSGLKVIESILEQTAEKMKQGVRVMDEIISFMALHEEKLEFPPLTAAERWLALPDHDNIEEIPNEGMEHLFRPNLIAAVENGELPVNTNLDLAEIAVWSIFYGVPLLFRRNNVPLVSMFYKQELSILWAGLRAHFKEYSANS